MLKPSSQMETTIQWHNMTAPITLQLTHIFEKRRTRKNFVKTEKFVRRTIYKKNAKKLKKREQRTKKNNWTRKTNDDTNRLHCQHELITCKAAEKNTSRPWISETKRKNTKIQNKNS